MSQNTILIVLVIQSKCFKMSTKNIIRYDVILNAITLDQDCEGTIIKYLIHQIKLQYSISNFNIQNKFSIAQCFPCTNIINL